MTIEELQRRCYEQAVRSGWAEPSAREIPVPEMCALLHSEVSEALESFRRGEPLEWRGPDGKPEGLASEFADIMIRLGHYAEALGINLDQAVEAKLAYNATRPYRHGGKAC